MERNEIDFEIKTTGTAIKEVFFPKKCYRKINLPLLL